MNLILRIRLSSLWAAVVPEAVPSLMVHQYPWILSRQAAYPDIRSVKTQAGSDWSKVRPIAPVNFVPGLYPLKDISLILLLPGIWKMHVCWSFPALRTIRLRYTLSISSCFQVCSNLSAAFDNVISFWFELFIRLSFFYKNALILDE